MRYSELLRASRWLLPTVSPKAWLAKQEKGFTLTGYDRP